jgi:hypothetical protein
MQCVRACVRACVLRTEVAHLPNEAPPRFLDLYDPKTVPFQPVYAMSSVVDESLRNVTGALQVKDMWPNTLMVVASDNVRTPRPTDPPVCRVRAGPVQSVNRPRHIHPCIPSCTGCLLSPPRTPPLARSAAGGVAHADACKQLPAAGE